MPNKFAVHRCQAAGKRPGIVPVRVIHMHAAREAQFGSNRDMARDRSHFLIECFIDPQIETWPVRSQSILMTSSCDE